MNEYKVHTILAEMIADYENGNAADDLQGFLAGWASRIAPTDAPAEATEVLVHGSPFDQGLSVEGPYPQGFLAAQELDDTGFNRYGGWWIVSVDPPTIA